MTRFVALALFVSLFCFGTAQGMDGASTFTFSNPELAGMHYRYDNPDPNWPAQNTQGSGAYLPPDMGLPAGNPWPNPRDVVGYNAVEFRVFFYSGVDYEGTGIHYFSQLGAGYDGPTDGYNNRWNDLTDYTQYMQSFHLWSPSEPADTVFVNLCLNTGWTDIGETDRYYESTWIEIPFCENHWLTLEFSDCTSYVWDPVEQTTTVTEHDTVLHLEHVTSIGVQFGLNLDFATHDNPADYDERNIALDTVPEPATLTLLLLAGLTLIRRKRGK